jgi:hypothetical protein
MSKISKNKVIQSKRMSKGTLAKCKETTIKARYNSGEK